MKLIDVLHLHNRPTSMCILSSTRFKLIVVGAGTEEEHMIYRWKGNDIRQNKID